MIGKKSCDICRHDETQGEPIQWTLSGLDGETIHLCNTSCLTKWVESRGELGKSEEYKSRHHSNVFSPFITLLGNWQSFRT